MVEYSKTPQKNRQSKMVVLLQKPDRHVPIDNPRDCWHEGDWLLFRVRASDGSYNVSKVPAWRVVAVGWREEADQLEG